jgi:hypothetical protein
VGDFIRRRIFRSELPIEGARFHARVARNIQAATSYPSIQLHYRSVQSEYSFSLFPQRWERPLTRKGSRPQNRPHRRVFA